MRKLLASLILAALCLPACTKPRMDKSSASAELHSTNKVADSLSEEDQRRFFAALKLIAAARTLDLVPTAFAEAAPPRMKPRPSPTTGTLTRRVHGLTGDEVIALADQFAAEMQRVHDLTADEVVALAHTLFEEAKTKRAASTACQRSQAVSFPCVEIRSLQAERGSSPNLGGPYAKVVGEMKNLGDKSLDEVELTVTLLDGSGKPLGEDQRRPVGLLSLDRDGAVAPLRPNGVRKFSTIIKAPPSKWAGKVEARITAVQFAEPKPK